METNDIRSELDNSIQELQKSIGVQNKTDINDILVSLEKGEVDKAKDLLKSIKTIDNKESVEIEVKNDLQKSLEDIEVQFDELQEELFSLQKSEDDGGETFVEGTELIEGILKSLSVLSGQVQELIKSNKDVKGLIKSFNSLAKVQLNSAEFLKSLDDKIGSIPLPTKGFVNSKQAEILKSKVIEKSFNGNENQNGISDRYKFLFNKPELINRLEKALDENKIGLTEFSKEEQSGFTGRTLNKSQVEILADLNK